MGDSSAGWQAVGCFTFAAFCFLFVMTGWTVDQLWYAVEYGIPPSSVHVDAKPTDCDFMHAPLGNKDCSYRPIVTTYDASHDPAKPWRGAGDHPPVVVSFVHIGWTKVP